MPTTPIKRNIVYLMLIQGGNYLFPLLLLPYLGRVLGVEQFGVLSYCQAITQYLIILTDYGFNLTATRRIAIARDRPAELARVYSSTMLVRLVLTAASFAILAISISVAPKIQAYWLIMAGTFIGVIGSALFPIWLFQGLEKMGALMFANVFSKFLSLAMVVLLVKGQDDTALAAACIGCSNLGMAAMAYYLVRKNRLVQYVRPSRGDLVEALKDGLPIFVSTIVTSSYMNFNSILLNHFHGNIAVGQFSMADKIRFAAQAGIATIVQAFYPRLSQLRSTDLGAAGRVFKKAAAAIGGAAVLAFVLIQLLASWAILTFVGPQFSAAIPLLRLEAVLLPVISIALIFGQLGLLAAGRAVEMTRIYIVVGILHMLYAIPLTMAFAATGTVISLIISETLASALILQRYLGSRQHAGGSRP
ncbi:MAG: flippase [Pseudomonadota bacterium]